MASFLPTRFDRAAVIGPADATGHTSGYRMLVSGNRHGSGADATLTLSDGSTILWSESWKVPDTSAVDLPQQISRSASRAALCLTEARGQKQGLVQPALGLYLNGCVELGESDWSDSQLLPTFERVTKLAPNFALGWAYVALGRAGVAVDQQDAQNPTYSAAKRSAEEAINTARRLDPQSGLPYVAEARLWQEDFVRSLAFLDRAVALDPANPFVLADRSIELRNVGRMMESADSAKRAVELDPLSPLTRSNYIVALTFAGQFSRARDEVAAARKEWPNDPQILNAEFGFDYRYGDARTAQQLMPRVLEYSDALLSPYAKLLAARLDPTPAKIQEAIDAFHAAQPSDSPRRNRELLALGQFGRVEDIYGLLADPKFQPVADYSTLFRPEFAGVRADKRFMGMMARAGLVRYWRTSGQWPDFCFTEKLRYDCKAEAARYG